MTCMIIEDQPPAQRILKKYIADYGSLELKATFADPLQAMEHLRQEPVELIFLDIHLPKMSGLDFLKSLPDPPHVILTTAFPDYALESYEFNVVDYLLKPFSFQRFAKAVARVPDPQSTSKTGSESGPREVFIKSGYELIRIAIDEIRYIKSDADYTELFLADVRHLSSESLRYWEENLPVDRFVRIHKSYIVNIDHIQKISGNTVYLHNEHAAPIGRAYKDTFLERINRIG